jgi:hypothetical protein
LNPAAAVDLAAKTLTLASTALYLLGYIDAGTFLSLITAAATLISTLIIHRMGKTIHAAAQRRRAGLSLKNAETTSPCPVCTHPARGLIEELVEAGVPPERVAERYPGMGRAAITQHIGLHTERRHQRDAAEELRQLLTRLKQLYAALELYTEDGEKLKPREYISAVNTKLDIIARMKDITIALEKMKTSAGEKDLTTLLQQLAEEKQET